MSVDNFGWKLFYPCRKVCHFSLMLFSVQKIVWERIYLYSTVWWSRYFYHTSRTVYKRLHNHMFVPTQSKNSCFQSISFSSKFINVSYRFATIVYRLEIHLRFFEPYIEECYHYHVLRNKKVILRSLEWVWSLILDVITSLLVGEDWL